MKFDSPELIMENIFFCVAIGLFLGPCRVTGVVQKRRVCEHTCTLPPSHLHKDGVLLKSGESLQDLSSTVGPDLQEWCIPLMFSSL